jgi:hypothetical protein
MQVCASVDGKARTVLVHRIVADAFLGPCPAGYQVDHVNGHKADNRAANLEYVTPSENTKRAWQRLGNFRQRDARGRLMPAACRELAARCLDPRDPMPLDQALDAAARLAGEVFDRAELLKREARKVGSR